MYDENPGTKPPSNQSLSYEYITVPDPYSSGNNTDPSKLYEEVTDKKSDGNSGFDNAASEINDEADSANNSDMPVNNSIHSSIESLQKFNAYEVVDAASKL